MHGLQLIRAILGLVLFGGMFALMFWALDQAIFKKRAVYAGGSCTWKKSPVRFVLIAATQLAWVFIFASGFLIFIKTL